MLPLQAQRTVIFGIQNRKFIALKVTARFYATTLLRNYIRFLNLPKKVPYEFIYYIIYTIFPSPAPIY